MSIPGIKGRSITQLRLLARRLVRECNGVAAVEFALIVTPMLAIYFGIVQVAQGVMIDRKVTQLNRTLADLTSQAATLSSTEMSNIFDASTMVMEPFTSVAPSMTVASIVVDGSGVARVCWSDSRPTGTALSRGSAFSLPVDLRVPNTSVVLARTTYHYTPAMGPVMTGAIDIKSNDLFMRPRLGKIGGTTKVEQVERTGTSSAMCPGFG